MGIPSLLIEHAYMDSPIDLIYLRDSAKVDEMGRRDAQAIVEYYGLSLEKENGNLTTVLGENGLLDVEVTDVSAPYSVEKVYVQIWSAKSSRDCLLYTSRCV